MTNDNFISERDYARACTAAGRELLTPRQAARLFGVTDAAVRTAASVGKVYPKFVHDIRNTPLYALTDLRAYFADRAEPDPELLTTMRENGVGCFMSFGSPGGWLLLSERPGLREWKDEAAS